MLGNKILEVLEFEAHTSYWSGREGATIGIPVERVEDTAEPVRDIHVGVAREVEVDKPKTARRSRIQEALMDARSRET